MNELYDYFNGQIEKLVDSAFIVNLVIYPFEKQGMLVKQILNWRGTALTKFSSAMIN